MSVVKVVDAKYYVPYVADGSERPGEWMASGAKTLGLVGKVNQIHLENLFEGLHPDGSRSLINRSAIPKGLKHVSAHDFVLNEPKDASIVSESWRDLERKLEVGRRKGVREVVRYVEANCAFTRRGHAGKHLEQCKPIMAAFRHYLSRANQPNDHWHLLILNVAAHINDEGFGTIVSKFLYDHQTAIKQIYLAALARCLQQMGLTLTATEPKAFEPGDSFKIVGIPDELRDLMSSRRAEILAARAKFGITTARGNEIAALATRNPKTHVPMDVLRQQWKKAAQSIGIDLAELRAAIFQPARQTEAFVQVHSDGESVRGNSPTPSTPKNNVRHLNPRIERREAIVDTPVNPTPSLQTQPQTPQAKSSTPTEPISPKVAASIIESITKSAIARKLPDPMIERLIDHVITQFDRKHPPEKVKKIASRTAEAKRVLPILLETSDQLRGNTRHSVHRDDIHTGLSGRLSSRDADEALVRLMGKTGAVACVETKAGVNANLFIGALSREYERAGFRVKAFTANPTAASELETVAGIKVNTVGQLLHRLRSSPGEVLKHHALQILRTAMDLPTAKLWHFDNKTIVVVTQAQTLSTVDLQRISSEAKSARAKVVLFGASDENIRREPHNAFTEIAKRTGKITLPAPAIQSQEWMVDALRQVARGDVRGAYSQYVLADRLHLAKDQRTATIELANHWKTLPKSEQNGKTLIIADSARDTRVLNKLAQQARRESGGLGLFMHQRVDGTWVHRGDRILFRIGSKHHGIRAGDLGTIERIGLNGMRIRLDRTKRALLCNRTIHVDVPKYLYRGMTLGYAVNAVDAQGMTCERTLVLPKAGGNDIRGLLVQLSCAREETRIFTSTRSVGEDIEAIAKSMRTQSQTSSMAVSRSDGNQQVAKTIEEVANRKAQSAQKQMHKQGQRV